jgi:polysaccharide pyruvyl transferase WcaK-like protein
LHAEPKGDIGVTAAQRALYKILLENSIDLSVSTPNSEIFKLTHPESKDMKVYRPLIPSIGNRNIYNHIQWIIFTAFNLTLLTFMAPLIQIGVKFSSRIDVIDRMRKCDAFIDLNLELIRGIPISVSPALIKQEPKVLVIHKLFWSFRILQNLWFLLIVKSIFKKKLIVGPASFGPFNGLPIIIKWLTKIILNRFVDLVLVREPCSAKLLDKLGVKNYQTVADVVILTRAERSSHSPIPFKPAIGVVPAMLRYTLTKEEIEKYVVAHARCLDELATKYEEVVFLPSSSNDIVMCQMIMARMKNAYRAKIIITDSVDEYESLIRRLKLLITTRMHPSIIASRNFIPFLSIIYDHKQVGFLLQIGAKAFSIPIQQTSYDNLQLTINKVIQSYDKIKENLKSTVPKLQDALTTTLLHSVNFIRKYQ